LNFFVSVAVLSSLYLVVAALEQVPALRFRPLGFLRPHLGTDIAWYALAVTNSMISVFLLQPQLSKLTVGPIGQALIHLPAAARLVLALMVFDFVAFAVHVGLHRSNMLWNVHKVHHSSLQLDWLAVTRAHMFENLVRFVAAQMVLYLIGVPIAQVAIVTATFAAFGLLDHSNLGVNLRWAEPIFVTPRLHRRHHVPETSQKNFGAVFSIWDRLFGTLVQRDTTADERFGVPGEIDSYPQSFGAAFRQPALQIREQRTRRFAPKEPAAATESP
jgi:sterol desaturase/sphingolipid hydroxylase (fatty acid hydroxylase superfamily)